MPPTAIVYLVGTGDPTRCAVAHYTHHLVAALRALGLPATIQTLPPDRRWDLAGVLRLALALRQAAVVHLQWAPLSFGTARAPALLPLLLPGRFYVTLHEYGGEWVPPGLSLGLWRRLAGWGERHTLWERDTLTLVTAARRVVVTNDHHRQVLLRRVPGLAARTVLIPIGPNIRPLATAAAAAARRAPFGDRPLLVFFGFVHPVKGLEDLLQALARLPAGRRPALAVVGGFETAALAGPAAAAYRAALQRQVQVLGLQADVVFTGHQPEAVVSAYLRAADLVVLPFRGGASTKNGALLAAWAHGAPVLTTAATPQDPLLRHGETVFLVPPRDPVALATAIDRLLTDPRLRARLGAGGRETAGRFAWEAIARAHRALYAAD